MTHITDDQLIAARHDHLRLPGHLVPRLWLCLDLTPLLGLFGEALLCAAGMPVRPNQPKADRYDDEELDGRDPSW